jgi:hypothetical protein
LRIVYFGTYERGYPRNAQVISCLRGAGVDVVERHVSVWEGREHKFSPGLAAALRLNIKSGNDLKTLFFKTAIREQRQTEIPDAYKNDWLQPGRAQLV